MTYAQPVTPELYAELIEDLELLKGHRNPWAASWLQILDTLEDEPDRIAVLAALISGLPALYLQMRDLGTAALKTIAFDVTFTPGTTELDALEDVFVPPKPPSVPDHLGALFTDIADHPLEERADWHAAPPAGPVTEVFDKAETELRRVRDNVRDRVHEQESADVAAAFREEEE